MGRIPNELAEDGVEQQDDGRHSLLSVNDVEDFVPESRLIPDTRLWGLAFGRLRHSIQDDGARVVVLAPRQEVEVLEEIRPVLLVPRVSAWSSALFSYVDHPGGGR